MEYTEKDLGLQRNTHTYVNSYLSDLGNNLGRDASEIIMEMSGFLFVLFGIRRSLDVEKEKKQFENNLARLSLILKENLSLEDIGLDEDFYITKYYSILLFDRFSKYQLDIQDLVANWKYHILFKTDTETKKKGFTKVYELLDEISLNLTSLYYEIESLIAKGYELYFNRGSIVKKNNFYSIQKIFSVIHLLLEELDSLKRSDLLNLEEDMKRLEVMFIDLLKQMVNIRKDYLVTNILPVY